MTMHNGFLIFTAAACIWPALCQDQTKAPGAKPSAKEMFLNPRQMPYGAQDETPAPAKPKVKPTTKPRVKATKPKPAEAAATDSGQSAAPQTVEHPVPIVRASYSNTPLGLRYTLQKRTSDGTTDVSPDAEFHSGDHIQLKLEVNDTGYLYIVSQGTSGTWSAMFPSPEIGNGDNRVERGRSYTVPPGHVFTFSGKPGTEKLFVVFSRQPVEEIDSLIYSLKGGRRTPTAAPGGEGRASEGVLVEARLDDSRIEALRAAYSRDLIIEKGDEEPAGQQQAGQQADQSVYVVNPKGSAESRVVADICLIHK